MLLLQITGLSGAGKTTLSEMVSFRLKEMGLSCIVIDGDVYRKTLCSDLGFSKADRLENIRRLGKLAHQHVQQGTIALIAAINPFEAARRELKELYNAQTVWVDCPLDTLKERDTKGLYRKAFLPEHHPDKLHNLSGVNDSYEKPLKADLYIGTHLLSPEDAAQKLFNFIAAQLAKPLAAPIGYNV
ncbi:adenylyl-sulfate kinase [Pedobacter sp. GSP4]|uniref:adenylyl-sulfate kinase n=1 Tax=Pedobacter sp. GSP4 TaxID=3453716 RepID=UPI003EEE2B09